VDSNVLVALISGMFSVASALGAVFLKDYLDTRRLRLANSRPEQPQPSPAPEQTSHPTAPSERATGGRSWTRPVIIVAGSFLFGMATRAARPLFTGPTHYESLAALVLLILLSLGLSIYHRRWGFQLPYQLEIVALWAGWASGWSLIHGGVWGDLLAVTLPWWLGCALIGGLVVSVRRPAQVAP